MIFNLPDLISKTKDGNEEATLEIIQRFTPLIKKYSKKLRYDGAETDLLITLLESIKNLSKMSRLNEGIIVNYIKRSIVNKYIFLSKRYVNLIYHEVELDTNIRLDSEEKDPCDDVCTKHMLDKLTDMQRKILIELYIRQKTESELAAQLKVSKQAINKTKNRALKKLKQELIN